VPALAQISDQGATIRRVAEWSSFDEAQQDLLGRFDRWRLVVRKGTEADGGTVEVAHEALFREWARLKEWLEPEHMRLEALRSLQIAAATWARHDKNSAFLDHRGKRLAEAGALGRNDAYRRRLGNVEFDYLAACRAAELAARVRTGRMQAVVGVLAVGIIAGLAAWWNQQWLIETRYWFTDVRGHVLAAESERALKPQAIFKECAKDCPEMIVVPAGRFTMGSPAGEGDDGEHPPHEVTIGQPFEVTFDEWDACVANGACARTQEPGWGRGSRPLINVSWQDAHEYVTWLSRMTGQHYRLLSEAEWEYAARAGTTTRYSFGDDEGMLGEHAWYAKNSDNRTHPVGKKKPNAFGLFDMHGNVWEWCEDNWHPNYEGAPGDGSVWPGGEPSLRVLRGGSWTNGPSLLRSAVRYGLQPGYRILGVGFRVARTLLPRTPWSDSSWTGPNH
jgi:formylglycine-generating enzyme required for sulfatase activity